MGLTKAEREERQGKLDNRVGLPQIAGLINDVFSVDPEIAERTPRLWWRRSYENWGISHPMPDPVQIIGPENRRRPFWHGRDILLWYADWKGVKLPGWVK